MRQIISFIKEKSYFFYLDIISLPTLFMKRKKSAGYHLKYVCHRCPYNRRIIRDVEGKGVCFWNHHWSMGNYEVPKYFGIKKWLRQYIPRKK